MKTILEVVRDLIKPYIDTNASNIATVEDSTVENPYYVGDQLIYKGVLYNVTADISIGDTLEIGTNISVAPKLSNSIKSALNKLKSNGTSSGTDFNFDIQNGVPGWNSAANRDSSTFHPFSSGSTASDISYDNTTSGLTATDVQTAIDEVDSNTDKKLPTYANGSSYWDTTPTNNSTKPVTSGGVKAQFDAVTNEFTDVNNILGAKNICPNNAVDVVSHGITYDILSDGSVNVAGTSDSGGTSGSDIWLNESGITLPAGTYKLTTGQSDEANAGVVLKVVLKSSTSTTLGISNANDGIFTLSSSTEVIFGLNTIPPSVNINVRIFPMCRVASITDDTYVPFAMTNKQLTTEISNFNDFFTISEVDITQFSNASGHLRLRRFGRIVIMQIDLAPTNANNVKISLPNGYKINGSFFHQVTYKNNNIYVYGYTNLELNIAHTTNDVIELVVPYLCAL